MLLTAEDDAFAALSCFGTLAYSACCAAVGRRPLALAFVFGALRAAFLAGMRAKSPTGISALARLRVDAGGVALGQQSLMGPARIPRRAGRPRRGGRFPPGGLRQRRTWALAALR